MSDQPIETVARIVNRVAIVEATKHAATAMTGHPAIGEAVGRAANIGYEHIPSEVKAGGAAGGFLAVNCATHAIAIGTPGAIAAGTAALSAVVPAIAAGMAIGGLIKLINDLDE